MESNLKWLRSCDLLIKNAYVFESALCRFVQKDVAVYDGMIVDVDKALALDSQQTLDGNGMYLIPGLVDIHMHIESSMTWPGAFYKQALHWGTTTLVADPHEIANVAGLMGIEEMLSNAQSLDIFFGIPSSVPSTNPSLETTGGILDEGEVSSLLRHPKMRCLGEVMNFADLKQEDSKTKRLIALCKKMRPDLLIEGHCPKISGHDLSVYLDAGVDADHTQQTPDSIMEKAAKGMFLEIQAKSINQANIDTLMHNQLYDHFCFVTDDCMANELYTRGHLNEVLKKAMKFGMPMEKVIYCATYTPARRMHLEDRGIIAPGKKADMVLLRDIKEWQIESVIKDGKVVGDIILEKPHFHSSLYHTIHLSDFKPEDFQLAGYQGKYVEANVMHIEPHSTFTRRVKERIPVIDGQIAYQKTGLNLIMVFERYGKNGRHAFGFVRHALQQKAALATTWAHDHHNLVVMGNDPDKMCQIANCIIEKQGGYGICDQFGLSLVQLSVGGIMSDGPLEQTAKELSEVTSRMKRAGYNHDNPIMSFATLSLPVSPELKITDAGLIDCVNQQILPCIERVIFDENND